MNLYSTQKRLAERITISPEKERKDGNVATAIITMSIGKLFNVGDLIDFDIDFQVSNDLKKSYILFTNFVIAGPEPVKGKEYYPSKNIPGITVAKTLSTNIDPKVHHYSGTRSGRFIMTRDTQFITLFGKGSVRPPWYKKTPKNPKLETNFANVSVSKC